MKAFLISAFTSMVALSSAAAVATPLEKRVDTHVYLCNDRNFSGYCVLIPTPFQTCGMSSLKTKIPLSQPVSTNTMI